MGFGYQYHNALCLVNNGRKILVLNLQEKKRRMYVSTRITKTVPNLFRTINVRPTPDQTGLPYVPEVDPREEGIDPSFTRQDRR